MTRESEPVRVGLIYDGADRWHSHAVRNADDRLNHRHPLHRNHSHTTGDAEQAQSALTPTQPVPSGLDRDLLTVQGALAGLRIDIEDHEWQDADREFAEHLTRTAVRGIEAVARLTAPVADEDNR